MIDDDVMDQALSGISRRDDDRPADQYARVWLDIKQDLRTGGPLARMVLNFRESAAAALEELAFVEPGDAKSIGRLQTEIRRHLETMRMIHGYKERAKAVDANIEAENDLSDDDRAYSHNLTE